MREDGVNSGARSFGRLCLALIPWALGIGMSVWLGVWIGIHQFRHTLSQEERAAVYTGAKERPKSKLKAEILNRGCVVVTHVDIDGDTLTVYARNDCHTSTQFMDWRWQLISPNGTILHQGWENGGTCPTPIEPGDQAECKMRGFEADDRGMTLRVWVTQ